MGNCMAFQIPPWQQTRGPPIEEAETESESKALATVPNININAPYKRYILVRRKLRNEEIHYLAPLLTPPVKPKEHCGTTEKRKARTRKVKIVVTLEQLELLLSGEKKKVQIRNRVVRFNQSSGSQRSQKWQPSLPAIPEVHNC